jgi:hypothetical protein
VKRYIKKVEIELIKTYYQLFTIWIVRKRRRESSIAWPQDQVKLQRAPPLPSLFFLLFFFNSAMDRTGLSRIWLKTNASLADSATTQLF